MKLPQPRAEKLRSKSLPAAAIFAVVLAMLALLAGCRYLTALANPSGDPGEEQSKAAPAQIAVENGQTYITLDEPTQRRLGLTVTELTSTVTRAQTTLPAVVLAVQELSGARNSYVAAQAQLQKARLQAGFAAQEQARLKTLYGEDQNISQKSLQMAEATLQSDEADVAAAGQQLDLQAASLRQQWGPAVAAWVTGGSAQLQRVLDGSDALIQLTMPSGTDFAAPRRLTVELPGVVRRHAGLVSAFPRLDPRIQGRSFLYRAAARPELAPGLNLVASLPVGATLRGVVIPASAVIWSEGKAWAYAEVAPGRFSRGPVATSVPVENGFFAAQGFAPGEKVVTVGAQALLSEEMLLHSSGGGGDED
jgi:hypothetical protein